MKIALIIILIMKLPILNASSIRANEMQKPDFFSKQMFRPVKT